METAQKWRLLEKYGGHTRSLYFGRHTRLGGFHSLNVLISGVNACFSVLPCVLQQGGGACDQLIRSNLGNLGRSADGRTVVYRSLDLEVWSPRRCTSVSIQLAPRSIYARIELGPYVKCTLSYGQLFITIDCRVLVYLWYNLWHNKS